MSFDSSTIWNYFYLINKKMQKLCYNYYVEV